MSNILNATDDTYDFAGAYRLKNVRIISSDGKEIDITPVVTQLNLFSSIYSPFVTGNIAFADTKNLVDLMPFTGEEMISFNFHTPSTRSVHHIDCTDFPMRVTRFLVQKASQRSQVYYIEFASLEFKRNNRTRSKRPLSGTYSTMVESVLRNDLKTRKTLYIEPTLFNQKFISHNVPPATLIQKLADRSISAKYESSGYLFYENFHNEFNFRSYTSLMYDAPGVPKQSVIVYHEQPETDNELEKQFRRVKKFELNRNYDHTLNTREGMYASKLITHDIHNKTYDEHFFRYDTNFSNTLHIEPDKTKSNLLAPRSFVDDDNSTLFDQYESRLMVASKSGDALFSEVDSSGNATYPYNDNHIEDTLQTRLSQKRSFENVVLTLTVHGNCALRPGQIIEFVYPFNASGTNEKEYKSELYSGRYVITKLRHTARAGDDTRHETILECVKDSLRNQLPVNYNNHHTKPKSKNTYTINTEVNR